MELAEILKGIERKFMLSINDHPDIRKVFNHKEVSLLYAVGQKGPAEANELIYSNSEFKEIKELSLFPNP